MKQDVGGLTAIFIAVIPCECISCTDAFPVIEYKSKITLILRMTIKSSTKQTRWLQFSAESKSLFLYLRVFSHCRHRTSSSNITRHFVNNVPVRDRLDGPIWIEITKILQTITMYPTRLVIVDNILEKLRGYLQCVQNVQHRRK